MCRAEWATYDGLDLGGERLGVLLSLGLRISLHNPHKAQRGIRPQSPQSPAIEGTDEHMSHICATSGGDGSERRLCHKCSVVSRRWKWTGCVPRPWPWRHQRSTPRRPSVNQPHTHMPTSAPLLPCAQGHPQGTLTVHPPKPLGVFRCYCFFRSALMCVCFMQSYVLCSICFM